MKNVKQFKRKTFWPDLCTKYTQKTNSRYINKTQPLNCLSPWKPESSETTNGDCFQLHLNQNRIFPVSIVSIIIKTNIDVLLFQTSHNRIFPV